MRQSQRDTKVAGTLRNSASPAAHDSGTRAVTVSPAWPPAGKSADASVPSTWAIRATLIPPPGMVTGSPHRILWVGMTRSVCQRSDWLPPPMPAHSLNSAFEMGAIDVRHRWSRCEPGCQECRDPSSAFFL